MSVIEQIIRPFDNVDVGPTPYQQPGATPPPPVIVQVGMQGGTLTFSGDLSYTITKKMGAVHKESSSSSQAINSVLSRGS